MKLARCYKLKMVLNNTEHHLNRLIETTPWVFPSYKGVKSNRGVCSTGVAYRYSGILVETCPWDKAIYDLMQRINKELGTSFNACLLNYYPANVYVGIGMHSDNEPELVDDPVVVSVSLGSSIVFELKGQGEHTLRSLDDGDVFVMGAGTQKYYQHAIPRTKLQKPRVSLTFRQFRD